MKKLITLFSTLCLLLALSACSQSSSSSEAPDDEAHSSAGSPSSVETEISTEPQTSVETEAQAEESEQTPITLTIGDTVLEAYFNNSAPAQSLIEQLPLTVTLNESTNDFCGGSLDIDYSESDVTAGYQNGDLVFWPPASNFVIFVRGEEDSMDSDQLVKLGHIISPLEMLDSLDGRIEVTIALQDE